MIKLTHNSTLKQISSISLMNRCISYNPTINFTNSGFIGSLVIIKNLFRLLLMMLMSSLVSVKASSLINHSNNNNRHKYRNNNNNYLNNINNHPHN